MDDVCTAVRFAMDQLGVTLKDKQKELFTTLFEAMTVSLFCQRGMVGLLTNRMLFDSIRRISNSNMPRLLYLELTYEYEPRVKFNSNSHAF